MDIISFQDLETALNCPICQDVFINPLVLNCSHSFCKFCAYRWLSSHKQCPTCRKPVSFATESLVLKNVVQTLIQNSSEQFKTNREKAVSLRTEEEVKQDQDPGINNLLKVVPNSLAVPLVGFAIYGSLQDSSTDRSEDVNSDWELYEEDENGYLEENGMVIISDTETDNDSSVDNDNADDEDWDTDTDYVEEDEDDDVGDDDEDEESSDDDIEEDDSNADNDSNNDDSDDDSLTFISEGDNTMNSNRSDSSTEIEGFIDVSEEGSEQDTSDISSDSSDATQFLKSSDFDSDTDIQQAFTTRRHIRILDSSSDEDEDMQQDESCEQLSLSSVDDDDFFN